jgi:ankyrin repeat protein
MSGGQLFSIFLYRCFLSIRDDNISVNSLFVRALLSAAEKNFLPAKAIVYRVFQSHQIEWPAHLEAKKISWLCEGAAIGCKIALAELERLDNEMATELRQTFCAQGGLLQLYATQKELDTWKRAAQHANIDSLLGEAEGIGQLEVTELGHSGSETEDTTNLYEFGLQTNAQNLDTKREDLLYLACIAGSTKLVQELCAEGCDASITRTPNAISCLHWLFTFPSEDVDNIAATLIGNGADVNAQLNTSLLIRNVHFPYSRPFGTPLHWATAASSIPAVLALLKHGADIKIRNREDPYKYNRDVREFSQESEDETVGSYSVPTQPCQGLTALDLATANHDWKLLQAILSLKKTIEPITDHDEEGYTAFHRLERNWIGRTWTSSRFWYSSFTGSDQSNHESLLLTIKVLVDMGGKIDQLTRLSPSNPTKAYMPGNMTPLMLAVRRMDLTATKALLECGANPNVRNGHGLNALSMLPERNSPDISLGNVQAICDLLIEHGTEVNAPSDCLYGWDPLACAVQCSNLGVVKALLKAGASRMKNQNVSVAAWLMVELPVQEFFNGSKVTRMDWDSRCECIVEIVREYFLSGAEAENQLYNVDPQGGSLLHYAVSAGNLGVVKYLLAQDSRLNVYRRDEKSTLNKCALSNIAFGTPLDICVKRIAQLNTNSLDNNENIAPQCKCKTSKLILSLGVTLTKTNSVHSSAKLLF